MILEQLRADAGHVLEGRETPSMYDWRMVHWFIDLAEDGSFRGFVPLTGGGRKGDSGREMAVPVVTRTSGDCPLLLTDSPEYVLGVMGGRKQANRHALFRDLVVACAKDTGERTVEAVCRFQEHLEVSAIPLPEGMMEKDTLTFRVGGVLPIDLPAVQLFWARQAEKLASEQECSICGTTRPVVASMPHPLKRIPGGQTSGTALVSTNASAFHSYGLEEVPSAHCCQPCAEVTHKVLNALLSGPRTHLRVGRLVYVFWTSAGDYSPLEDLDQPDPESVQRLIQAYRTGRPLTDIEDTAFHATALSASGGRAVVRDWLTTTVGAVKQNLGRWFEWQQIVDPYGEAGRPFGIYRLGASLYRDASKEMPALVPQQLTRAALNNVPLPDALIIQALNRMRSVNPKKEDRITHARAALIKTVLASQPATREVGETMMELDLSNRNPAYLCGRLLAELEEIQRRAIPGISATLVDRYFGTASTAPASVFGRLLSGAQPHLSKLRKTNEGASYGAQARLEEIMAPLSGFPATLTLKDQALFSLGYYHQRAATRSAKAEARARKAGQKEADPIQSDATKENEE